MSYCVLHFAEKRKKEKAAATHETEQKRKSNKTRNFQGDPFTKRPWTTLFNRSGLTVYGAFQNSR